MTPAASPPKASPARGQPSSWGRRRVRLSRPPGGLGPRANPRLQRSWRFGDYQVAAHLIIPARWTPWPPLDSCSRACAGGVKRSANERPSVIGWQRGGRRADLRMNCNRRGDRGAPPLKRLSARAGRRAQATMSALITNFVFVIFQFLAAAAPLKRRPALQQEYFP